MRRNKNITKYFRPDDLIRKGKKILYPLLGNIIGSLTNIGQGLGLPTYYYEDYVHKALEGLHDSRKSLSRKYQPPPDTSWKYKGNQPASVNPYLQYNPFPVLSTKQIPIPNSFNPGNGLGNKGAYELAPSNIGDPQELLEQKEIFSHNPIPKSYKIAAQTLQDEGSIFRKTNKKMPVSLMLPGKKTKHRVYKKKNKEPTSTIIEGSQIINHKTPKPGNYKMII